VVGPGINDPFTRAQSWTWPRCPIVLDLDGDGLETVGLAANIHFDHDGDGVLTRTGWVGGDDALLVLDRNADGLIGSGAELFGDFTPLPNGALAPDGYAALAVLDANRDGVLDARDPAFADLKLWRDVSQDGVSQPGELMTLAEAGIVSLDLAHTAHNQRLANGNTLTAQGSFTRADGSRGGMGEFLFDIDTFTTRFATPIEVPEALRGLPDVGGSGNVRDLQQAAAQSPALASLLGEFAAAPSRSAQLALLDALLDQWADTSGMAKSLEERSGGRYRIRYQGFGSERRSAHVIGSAPNEATLMSDLDATTHLSASYRALIGEWSRKLQVLEAFNGQHFFILPHERSQGAPAVWGLMLEPATGSTPPRLWVDFSQPQLDLLQQAWDSLKESVYGSLVLQTRLRPYLDAVQLVIHLVPDGNGLHFDASPIDRMIADKRALDPAAALSDLLELDRYASGLLAGAHWRGQAELDVFIGSLERTAGVEAVLAEFNVSTLGSGNDTVTGTRAAEIVLGEGPYGCRRWCANDEECRWAA
jgi:hypothetical protein